MVIFVEIGLRPPIIIQLLALVVTLLACRFVFIVVLDELLVEGLPFGCTGAKSLGYALSHSVRIIAKECFHQQSPTLFGRYIGGKDCSDFLTSLLKHSNDICLTLVERCLILYLCIGRISIAKKIEGIVCALLHYARIVVLLDSLTASILLLCFELEISLRVPCSFGKDFSKD